MLINTEKTKKPFVCYLRLYTTVKFLHVSAATILFPYRDEESKSPTNNPESVDRAIFTF